MTDSAVISFADVLAARAWKRRGSFDWSRALTSMHAPVCEIYQVKKCTLHMNAHIHVLMTLCNHFFNQLFAKNETLIILCSVNAQQQLTFCCGCFL